MTQLHIKSRPNPARRVILALMLREMSTRYGQSAGGYLWAVIEPLGAIFILAAGYGMVLSAPPLGVSHIVFLASGFLPFALFQSMQVTVARSLIFSRPLLNYPIVRWFHALVARVILNGLTGVLIAAIVLAVVFGISPTRAVPQAGLILGALGMALLLGVGIGALNAALMGLWPVWEQIWSIATRPLFFVSGVFFLPETLPQWAQDILWFNPLIHVVGMMRDGLYGFYSPQIVPLYAIGAGLLPLAMGLLLLARFHHVILSR
ncbi:ABC transporter permease [Rhodobacteraceae bacterium XHP0102]|nr:ABC transporter permease [Rhodobacteraceae bacterium XHP0102]